MKKKKKQRCSVCRGADHNRTTCPAAPPTVDPESYPFTREELSEVFDSAEEMVGGGDPDYIDEGLARVRRIRKQVWAALGWTP